MAYLRTKAYNSGDGKKLEGFSISLLAAEDLYDSYKSIYMAQEDGCTCRSTRV